MWVWGDNGPDAALESALTPPQLISDLEDKEGLESGRVQPANVGMNNVAHGWDTMMDNLLVRGEWRGKSRGSCVFVCARYTCTVRRARGRWERDLASP